MTRPFTSLIDGPQAARGKGDVSIMFGRSQFDLLAW